MSDAFGLRSGCPAKNLGSGVSSFFAAGGGGFVAAGIDALAALAVRVNGNNASATAAGV